jgi:hypothetical protein
LDNIITIEKVNKRERNLIIKEKIKIKKKSTKRCTAAPFVILQNFGIQV